MREFYYEIGLKTLWQKEKSLVLSNFFFCHNVFKILLLVGKGYVEVVFFAISLGIHRLVVVEHESLFGNQSRMLGVRTMKINIRSFYFSFSSNFVQFCPA